MDQSRLVVALNAFVEQRGVSGTTTAVAALRKALNKSDQVELRELAGPSLVRGARIRNLVKMLRWDFGQAARCGTRRGRLGSSRERGDIRKDPYSERCDHAGYDGVGSSSAL